MNNRRIGAVFPFDQLWQMLDGAQLVFWLLWAGLIAFTVALMVLLWTRWGQSKPLVKCLVLSLYAHLLMGIYATTVQLTLPEPGVEEPPIHVAILDDDAKDAPATEPQDEPWEQMRHESVTEPEMVAVEREDFEPLPEPPRETLTRVEPLSDTPALDHVRLSAARTSEAQLHADRPEGPSAPVHEAESIDTPAAERREAPQVAVPAAEAPQLRATPEELAAAIERTASAGVASALLTNIKPLPRLEEARAAVDPGNALSDPGYRLEATAHGAPPSAAGGAGMAAAAGEDAQAVSTPGETTGVGRTYAPSLTGLLGRGAPEELVPVATPGVDPNIGRLPIAGSRRSEAQSPRPDRYQLRTAPNRAELARQQGATPETERAVQAALRWLAQNQAADGHWDARDHGAGREDLVLGRNRQNAGIEADTGVTGLALLAFLAAGHTHLEGDYRETVRRGLEYLLRSQARDGNLGGAADSFARMYCHAMGTLALSEALGMTRDERLRDAVRRALAYTVACQSPSTGGWRYVPADPGDTSQLGWQWMALVSGESAGIAIPEPTRQGVIKYLRSVSSGKAGGYASYRPGEAPSRTMTAEALYCWELLGLAPDHPAVAEATEAILGETPGTGKANCYYWYYATLALYQLQNDAWRRWNDAVSKTLIARQRLDGTMAGSWDTDTVWGGYGGRVYTTAIGALTLEVYYRYLPLYSRVVTRPAEMR